MGYNIKYACIPFKNSIACPPEKYICMSIKGQAAFPQNKKDETRFIETLDCSVFEQLLSICKYGSGTGHALRRIGAAFGIGFEFDC